MSVLGCGREGEVRDLLLRGQWPHAGPVELRAHAEACRACGELVLVMGTLLTARAESMTRARVQPPGLVLWRAQLRRRHAAMERVVKPIWRAEVFAALVSLCVAVGLVAWMAVRGEGWRAWLGALSPAAVKAQLGLMPLLVGVGALVLLAGVALYVSGERE